MRVRFSFLKFQLKMFESMVIEYFIILFNSWIGTLLLSWNFFFLEECRSPDNLDKTAIFWEPFSHNSFMTQRYKVNSFRGDANIHFRTQCVIMTQIRWPPTPCHLCHSQNFDKIDSFLKPILNIFILRNSIVEWRRGLLKRGLASCIKSVNLRKVLIVGGSRVHQSES